MRLTVWAAGTMAELGKGIRLVYSRFQCRYPCIDFLCGRSLHAHC
jgi:hypothetical protein